MKISGTAREIPQIEQFRGGEKLFLAGSSWKGDEEIITGYINRFPGKVKWIFAPHEIDKPNIDRLERSHKSKSGTVFHGFRTGRFGCKGFLSLII